MFFCPLIIPKQNHSMVRLWYYLISYLYYYHNITKWLIIFTSTKPNFGVQYGHSTAPTLSAVYSPYSIAVRWDAPHRTAPYFSEVNSTALHRTGLGQFWDQVTNVAHEPYRKMWQKFSLVTIKVQYRHCTPPRRGKKHCCGEVCPLHYTLCCWQYPLSFLKRILSNFVVIIH